MGLTENASALRRWMLYGPEINRFVNEFEVSMATATTSKSTYHHKPKKAFQTTLLKASSRSHHKKKPSFEGSTKKKPSKTQPQLSSVKTDCSLFSRPFIACQTGNGDLIEFFKYKNQACFPSISDGGDLCLPRQQLELASCLQELTSPWRSTDMEVFVIDGAALVNMLKPHREHRTFSGYANTFNTNAECDMS